MEGGVRYFSWSGTRPLTNVLDVSDAMLTEIVGEIAAERWLELERRRAEDAAGPD